MLKGSENSISLSVVHFLALLPLVPLSRGQSLKSTFRANTSLFPLAFLPAIFLKDERCSFNFFYSRHGLEHWVLSVAVLLVSVSMNYLLVSVSNRVTFGKGFFFSFREEVNGCFCVDDFFSRSLSGSQ